MSTYRKQTLVDVLSVNTSSNEANVFNPRLVAEANASYRHAAETGQPNGSSRCAATTPALSSCTLGN